MSQQLVKKDTERHHLGRFLSLQGIQPDAIRSGDPLDFVLDLGGGRRVGVELVGVDNEAQRQTNAMAERYVRRQLDAYLRERGYVIEVQLIWKCDLVQFAEYPERCSVFLDKLMAVISKEVPLLGDGAFVLSDDKENHQLEDLDLAELSDLMLRTVDHLTEPRVLSIPTAWAQATSGIMTALRRKEAKISEYKKILGDGEVWLLLVTGARFEQNVHASFGDEQNMQSKFDHVFLLDLREETVRTLK